MTGRSNFDVAEWLALAWWRALSGRHAVIALLVKATTARRTLAQGWAEGLQSARAHWLPIDARRAFGIAVDAGLWVLPTRGSERACEVHPPLDAAEPADRPNPLWALASGRLVADRERYDATAHLLAAPRHADPWRSGVKHDCAAVLELSRAEGGEAWVNGLGELLDIEEERLHPFAKCTDVARGRAPLGEGRRLVLTQTALGEDTSGLAGAAPRTWAYLQRHAERFVRRKSRVYAGQPPFSLFGIGAYAFAPWKVAISGLHKSLEFALVGPIGGRPVLFDDTVYYLPCESEAEARAAHAALQSEAAREFFAARIFWDSKRPITAALLRELDWRKAYAMR